MALESFFERANNIQAEYDELLSDHKSAIRALEEKCRKSEDGHVWLKVSKPPTRYLGPPTYIQVCQCCGFYCKTSGQYDTNLITKALSAEMMLSPEKEDIRKMAIEEYGEKQDMLDSLNAQLTAVKEEMRKILDRCQEFLGEKSKPVRHRDDDGCYWKD